MTVKAHPEQTSLFDAEPEPPIPAVGPSVTPGATRTPEAVSQTVEDRRMTPVASADPPAYASALEAYLSWSV